MAEADKTQLGLTDAAREKADRIVQDVGFRDRQEAYRLAITVALVENLEPAPDNVSRMTYINVGSLDPSNELRAAVLHLRSDHNGRPAALIERLAEAGIDRIFEHIDAGRPLRDLLKKYRTTETSARSEQNRQGS